MSIILDKVVEKDIFFLFVENSNIIPPYQFGLGSRHSTLHELQLINEPVVRGFEKKEYSTVAFLDAGQASDKVWHDGLLFKLKEITLHPTNTYNKF